MIRKFKALGLALVAVMALSGVAASGAQALSEIHIRSGKNAVLTSDETIVQHVLKLGAAEVRCENAEFEGTITGSGGTEQRVSHVQVTANYGHPHDETQAHTCQLLGGPATVQMNGCKYTLKGTADPLRATAAVVGCTAGLQITVTSSACQLHIPEQGDLSHVMFENRTNAPRLHDVDVRATVVDIRGIEKRGLFCPSATEASFEGTTTVQAYEDTGVKDRVTLTGHQYEKTTDNGVELGIEAR